jgi:hypothetical protein
MRLRAARSALGGPLADTDIVQALDVADDRGFVIPGTSSRGARWISQA